MQFYLIECRNFLGNRNFFLENLGKYSNKITGGKQKKVSSVNPETF